MTSTSIAPRHARRQVEPTPWVWDAVTETIPVQVPFVVPHRRPWPKAAMALVLVAGIVAVVAGTLLTVRIVDPAAFAVAVPSAPVAGSTVVAPMPSAPPAPAASATPVPDLPSSSASTESTASSGADDPSTGSGQIGGPSPTGWTDGNGNPVPDPFVTACGIGCLTPDAPQFATANRQFLKDLKAQGIVTPGTQLELQAGLGVCQNLDRGSFFDQEARILTDAPYDYSPSLARYFVERAVHHYCPELGGR